MLKPLITHIRTKIAEKAWASAYAAAVRNPGTVIHRPVGPRSTMGVVVPKGPKWKQP